jgi:hypothetical protein
VPSGSRDIEHIGSAHDDAELEVLQALARQRLAAGQGVLDARASAGGPGRTLPITSSRMGHLLDALTRAYDLLGFGRATGGDEVFRQLVLAWIIEAVSKLDSLRVLEEAGVAPTSYATLKRRLPACATASWPHKLAAASRHTPAWVRPAWSCMTCRPCISRSMPGTGSARAGSPRSAGWNRRSRSGCSRTRPGSR